MGNFVRIFIEVGKDGIKFGFDCCIQFNFVLGELS